MREYTPTESIDLVYLDPPFNSNRNYSVLFRDESGKHSEAQIEAFEDTWHWSEVAEETYRDLVTESADEVAKAISAIRAALNFGELRKAELRRTRDAAVFGRCHHAGR